NTNWLRCLFGARRRDGVYRRALEENRRLPSRGARYAMKNGCKWRRLPARFGNWHTIYTRMNRWSKSGVWDRVFERLQQEGLVQLELKVVSLDSTSIRSRLARRKKRPAGHR
ncbi:MAG: transposase, partial [Burkholderiales bacterium]|nr:transposase [Opitutaceae bacterium]